MKVRPTRKKGKVVVELNPTDEQLLVESGKRFELVSPPFRLKRILVPIDFSACSKKALRYAIPFAEQFKASLTLLYVVQVNYAVGELGAIDVSMLEGEMRQQAAQRLSGLVEDEVRKRVPVEAMVRTGRPVAEIVRAARELEADLIIVSTRGYTGLKHVLLGSTAENVLRHAPCPVLAVREHGREFIDT
jgi:nucleotide-binding universal stress UspA family protein